MKKIPKYISRLLARREKLANDLLSVCVKLDRYCETIGVDLADSQNALVGDVRIYCEPSSAYLSTLRAIKNALGIVDQTQSEGM